MSDTPNLNRRNRRAAAATASAAPATAPVAPAIDASVERAAIERGDMAMDAPVGDTAPATVAQGDVVAPEAGTAVLPEPTLVARPDAPLPIVTASPILASEPSAVDVAKAEVAAADPTRGPFDPVADPLSAAAGQPTLTIEGGVNSGVAAAAARILDDPVDGRSERLDVVRGHVLGTEQPREGEMLSADEIMRHLDRLAFVDPAGFEAVRVRFLADYRSTGGGADRSALAKDASDTVAMVEVVGPLHGRRRAGRLFGPTAQRFRHDELSDEEFDAICADPLLTVGLSRVDAALSRVV